MPANPRATRGTVRRHPCVPTSEAWLRAGGDQQSHLAVRTHARDAVVEEAANHDGAAAEALGRDPGSAELGGHHVGFGEPYEHANGRVAAEGGHPHVTHREADALAATAKNGSS